MSKILFHLQCLREHCREKYSVKYPPRKYNTRSENNCFMEFRPVDTRFHRGPLTKEHLQRNTIHFFKEDTLKTALNYKKKGMKPLVVILADDETPGGTLISNCQEETLFRRTALMAHLTPDLYPIKSGEIIYVPHVSVYSEDDTCSGVFNEMCCMDFAALASVKNYNGQEELREIMKEKMRLLLNRFCISQNDVIILGALGCGAYGCNGKAMATLLKEVICEFKGLTIAFAILGANYGIFKNAFEI